MRVFEVLISDYVSSQCGGAAVIGSAIVAYYQSHYSKENK